MSLEYVLKIGIEDVQNEFDINEDLYKKYVVGEIEKNQQLVKLIDFRNELPDWKVHTPLGGMGTTLNAFVLYCLIRHYKMSDIIETGVSGGFYTAFMLCALNANNNYGLLTSLEISDDMKEVGKLVPKFELADWDLRVGKSSLDYFYQINKNNESHSAELYSHDSLHIFPHMLKELNEFKKSLSDKFIIYIDDQTSDCFWDKCINFNLFRKDGYDVKYISGKESRLQGHLGGFIKFEKK